MDSEDYELVDRVADALVEFTGLQPSAAREFAERMTRAFGLSKQNRWVPHTDKGECLEPVYWFSAADDLMDGNSDVVRVDREYRFVSRWFNPSRED